MKKLYALSLLLLLTSSNLFSQGGWFQLASPSNRNIYAVYFINNDTGFIGLDSGKIYKTLNGGLNWSFINISTTNIIDKIIFVDPNTGYLVCFRNYNTQNLVYKSTDSGLNWILINIPYYLYPEDIYFLNSETGYIANFTSILRTTNGGITWDSTVAEVPPFTSDIQYYGIYFKNSLTGFLCGSAGTHSFHNKVIWMTVNAGQNWTIVHSLPGSDYSRTSFANEYTGYSVGASNSVSKTTDGGFTWNPVNLNLACCYANLGSLQIINSNKVFTCGRWGAYNTINGGLNWSSIQIPYEAYYEVFFPDSNTGYVAGDQGRIYKTTNGGVSAIEQISNEIPQSFSLHQNYPNPFNPATKIKFDLPKQSNAKVIIYDLLGREVTTLVNEQLKPGSYEVEWDGSGYASGMYFYSLQTESFTETKRMVLIK